MMMMINVYYDQCGLSYLKKTQSNFHSSKSYFRDQRVGKEAFHDGYSSARGVAYDRELTTNVCKSRAI